MKVGIDIHNCIDLYPEYFSELSHQLVLDGHEVHIITGQRWEEVQNIVEEVGVIYTHHYSIVDYHLTQPTKMWQDERGTWWMDKTIWTRSKGDYIHREGITLHFDDQFEYANYIPQDCTFILVSKIGFVNTVKELFS